MSGKDELDKKINSTQEKLKDNSKKVNTLFEEYKNTFLNQYEKYISKIMERCEKRKKYYSKVKDENKTKIYKETINVLDNLLKENEDAINSVSSSFESLKSLLIKEPNIFKNDEANNNANSTKNKLVIQSTDDCGKAKTMLSSEEGQTFEIYKINKITTDDFKYLFGEKKKDDKTGTSDNYMNKVKKLKFKSSILKDIDFCDYFPNVENLSITECQIGYNIAPKLNFSNISNLSLEGVELVSENFEDLLIFLLNSKTENSDDYIGRNLKSLSVKKNKISRIIFPEDVDYCSKKNIKNKFVNLEFLDLSENNLFDYYTDNKHKLIFKDIKLLDISNNNFTSAPRIEKLIKELGQSCLIFASKNIGIMKNQKISGFYCNYLIDKLKKIEIFKYNIKSFVFEGLFKLKDKPLLLNLKLNKFNATLVELNLSFNNLNDEDIIKIFDNNKNLQKLKRLNLSSNEITEVFFKKYHENEYYKNYKNLKVLNLSCNPIFFHQADVYKNFLSSCKNLESLILKNTVVGEDMNNYLKNKIIVFTAKQKRQIINNNDPKINEMESLIDKNDKGRFLKEHSKASIIISYVIKPKYITFVKRYFPYLLERLKLE